MHCFPSSFFFSLYLLKSSVINLFKPSGDGGRKLTLITRSERGLIIIDTNISVVHRTEYRIASSCVAQKTASSKASFCSVERSKDCNHTALSNVTLVVHLLFPLLHLQCLIVPGFIFGEADLFIKIFNCSFINANSPSYNKLINLHAGIERKRQMKVYYNVVR